MKYHSYAWILATSALSLVHHNSAGAVLAEKVDGVQDPAGDLEKSSNDHDQRMLLRRSYLSSHDTDTQNEVDSGSNLRMLKSEASKKNKISWSYKNKSAKENKSKDKKSWTRSKSSKSAKRSKKTDGGGGGIPQECSVDYCEAKQINLGSMQTCLNDKFQHLSNLYFPGDGEDYDVARYTAFRASRYPAAVVYVEDVDEVKAVLECAVNNGYKVSPRGGNHSYQGLGTMDGYVVIDMGRTCKLDEFVINKDDQGPHILEGSKYIGTMKAQAGCTNAAMLAAGHTHFKEEGGMTLIGSCPSVGITGFVLGGGAGDVSPYVGYAVDIVKEFQIVLYDGTVVKASEDENPDLYWASRGGGGGNGVVTHLTYKVVQAPRQKYEEVDGKKFTVMRTSFILKPEKFEEGAARFQEWFYDADPLITGKFGGALDWFSKIPYSDNITTTAVDMTNVYLGSWREAIEDLQTTGLYDDELFQYVLPSGPARTDDVTLAENHEILCRSSSSSSCTEFEDTPGAMVEFMGDKVPITRAFQFDSYAEAEAFHICIGGLFNSAPNGDFAWSNTSGDFCKDLGIDDDKCEDKPFNLLLPNPTYARVPKSCNDKVVIDAMLQAAGDPSSFINSHGPSPELIDRLGFFPFISETLDYWSKVGPLSAGASMFPRFDDAFFAKLIKETSEGANHLQHGAALQVHPDDTAYPWRNAAFQVEYDNEDSAKDFIGRILEGGYTPQGYYAYLNPAGMKKWRSYFFGDKWKKLSKIRAEYDPKDVFGKPLTIESIGE